MLGALGALLFNIFALPVLLVSPYFADSQFVKNFKEGKVLVTQKDYIYIQENTALEEAIERVKNSVVVISGNSVASGFIASSDGNVITLANVIPTNGKLSVFLNGESVNVTVTKTDYKNNLALLKIEKNGLQTTGFADFNKIKLGQKVFLAVPTSIKGDNWLANEGIIREMSPDSMQTTMVEKPIANGSPLFNVAGQLIGLNAVDKDGKISAIPISKVQELLGL